MRTMAGLLLALALVGCAGPQQQNRYAETPIAETPRTNYEAPPANSLGDVDRDALIRQFDDMRWAQQAHEEASQPAAQTAPPAPPPQGPPGMTPAKKVGPAEQAPLPPPKNLGLPPKNLGL